MNKKKTGLGKGLGALLPGSDVAAGWSEVPTRSIAPNPHQPRLSLDETTLRELADSIREHGLIQPLVVTRSGENAYTLIAGERRWRAALLIGLDSVPVVVKDVASQQMLELALIENVQRDDLNPLEEALAYRQLIDDFGLTQEQVSQRVGKSRVAVANIVRLLKLPESIQKRLADGSLSEGHARALLMLNDTAHMQRLVSQIVSGGLSVRQVEEIVRRLNAARLPAKKRKPADGVSANTRSLEDKLRRALGTKVNLYRSSRGGKVVIHFYSEDELDAIYRRITQEDH
ncbi:MAG TPA: ParB/RepB/Spo0J family partition protein [Anaerolineae bacterium]|nr:ParB/RepB/Spo0J family partition protein [Anaerolineae bacterium]